MRNKTSKSTANRKLLKSLGKRKPNGEEYCCSKCHKIIKGNLYKFKCHLFQHRAVEAVHKCPHCTKEFFRNDIFSRHLKMHTGDIVKKQYVCDYCDRSFCEKRNLIIHMKIHNDFDAFRYKCMACGITYGEERLLKYHIRKTHYNLHVQEDNHIKKELNETWVERVKESEVCVQITKVNNNMISIKKLGTKIKNETAPTEVRTGIKVNFKDYINSVFAHNDKSQYSRAKCDYCNKEMLKKSLLTHIRERHLKLRKFKCEECNRSFSRQYQLVDHVCGNVRWRKIKKEMV